MLSSDNNQEKKMKQKKGSFEAQLTQLSLSACLPFFFLLLWLMIYAEISIYLTLLTFLLGSLNILYCHNEIHQKSSYQFRSLSNLLEAMNQGDYSVRARASHGNEALNELVVSINNLSERLNEQRINMVESQLLLKTVINHIDVAIIATDNNDLILTNPAANKLLQLSANDLEGSVTSSQQLAQIPELSDGQNQVMTLNFAGHKGQFNVHREAYRQSGKQQTLLFITDVSNMLRSEERKAWQSLVRVISHEINNSLAPIASISQSLTRLLTRPDSSETSLESGFEEKQSYLIEGLAIVSQRARNLTQFVNSYKQIASLPEPNKESTSIEGLVTKVVKLYGKDKVILSSATDVNLSIDSIQFEQVLINLIKNSIEATAQLSKINCDDKTKPYEAKILIDWQVEGNSFILTVTDNGTGVSNPDNLFVPFYTTKKDGSGIGLALSRQMIEGHNGKLTLKNKSSVEKAMPEVIPKITKETNAEIKKVNLSGCIAVIELPYR